MIGDISISACYIVRNENSPLFECSLKSVINKFDEVIVIEGGSTDGTVELLDSYDNPHMKIIHNKWKGNDGYQREQYLKYATGDWNLVIDGDEVLSDNGIELYNLAKEAEKKGIECFDIHMRHFFYHLGLEDASSGGKPPRNEVYKHYVPRRFFKNKQALWYPYVEHNTIQGHSKYSKTDKVTLFHYSDCRQQFEKTIPKSMVDLKRSNIHSKDYMKWWRMSRLFGTYPLKPFKEGLDGHPLPVRKLVKEGME